MDETLHSLNERDTWNGAVSSHFNLNFIIVVACHTDGRLSLDADIHLINWTKN